MVKRERQRTADRDPDHALDVIRAAARRGRLIRSARTVTRIGSRLPCWRPSSGSLRARSRRHSDY